MKQQNRIFIDISKCKVKETFTLCTLSLTYFEPFLREKCFFQVKIRCLGQTPAMLRTCKLIEKAL